MTGARSSLIPRLTLALQNGGLEHKDKPGSDAMLDPHAELYLATHLASRAPPDTILPRFLASL